MFTVSKMQEYEFSLNYIFQYYSTIYAIVVRLLLEKVAHIKCFVRPIQDGGEVREKNVSPASFSHVLPQK